jgi:hypothetical protein
MTIWRPEVASKPFAKVFGSGNENNTNYASNAKRGGFRSILKGFPRQRICLSLRIAPVSTKYSLSSTVDLSIVGLRAAASFSFTSIPIGGGVL